MSKIVVSRSNLPARSPWMFFAVAWLFADRFGVSGWGWAPFIFVAAMIVLCYLAARSFEEAVGIEPDTSTKSLDLKGTKNEEEKWKIVPDL